MHGAIPPPPELESMLDQASLLVPGLDKSAVLLSLALLQTSRRVLSAFAHHLERYGTTQARFATLLALLLDPESLWTPARLAERAQVTPASMTAIVDGLVRDGLVARRDHAHDRRKKLVEITPAGAQAMARMLPDHFQRLSDAFSSVSPAQRAASTALFTSVSVALDALVGAEET